MVVTFKVVIRGIKPYVFIKTRLGNLYVKFSKIFNLALKNGLSLEKTTMSLAKKVRKQACINPYFSFFASEFFELVQKCNS